MKILLTILAIGLFIPFYTFAQCLSGELEVEIEVLTDDFGYETYWEIVPGGDPCGTNTIYSGGNSDIGCNGGGVQAQDPGGYDDNTSIMEGPWCLTENGTITIHSVDDWGDAHAGYKVFIEGALVAEFLGFSGDELAHTFTVALPAALDMSVTRIKSKIYGFEGENFPITGDVRNLGVDVITSFDLNYSINGWGTVTDQISGVNIGSGDTYDFEHSTDWAPPGWGTFDLEVWASNINGAADQNLANDALNMDLIVNTAVPNIIDLYLSSTPTLDVVAGINEDILVPRDLDFHPDFQRGELWVLNKDTEASGGSTVTFSNVGETNQNFEWKRDGNAWHFMSLPTAIAMADNGNFGTSPGVFDANHDGAPAFTGVSLWSTDMSIYAEPSGGNGSHLDMLHVNPESQGMAHESLNRFWCVDGYTGDIVMNDFVEDHGAGNGYHGDAIIKRYGDFLITKDPNDHIVSHCVLDKGTGWLYVVDHGGDRVLRMDINTGTSGGPPSYPQYEPYAEYGTVTGYTYEEIVTAGLVEPAGIDVIGDRMIVSDHSNGDIVIFDISSTPATELGRITTGSAGVMGVKIGPEGFIWYVNATTHELVRVLTGTAGIQDQEQAMINVHPNPGNGLFYFSGLNDIDQRSNISVMDLQGKVLKTVQVASVMNAGLDLSELADGIYNLSIQNGNSSINTRVVLFR